MSKVTNTQQTIKRKSELHTIDVSVYMTGTTPSLQLNILTKEELKAAVLANDADIHVKPMPHAWDKGLSVT